MKLYIVLFLLFVLLIENSKGLQCYVCSFTSYDSDKSCETVTESTQIVDCTYTYCIIVRQEFTDPAGEIASFVRSCLSDPDYLNHVVEDSTFKTYYRACTSDLCNIGNGIESVTGGSLSATPIRDGVNLLVPGTGSSSRIKISIFTFLVILFIYLL